MGVIGAFYNAVKVIGAIIITAVVIGALFWI